MSYGSMNRMVEIVAEQTNIDSEGFATKAETTNDNRHFNHFLLTSKMTQEATRAIKVSNQKTTAMFSNLVGIEHNSIKTENNRGKHHQNFNVKCFIRKTTS